MSKNTPKTLGSTTIITPTFSFGTSAPPPAPPPAASFTLNPLEPLSLSQLLRDTHTPVKDGSNAKKQDVASEAEGGGSTGSKTGPKTLGSTTIITPTFSFGTSAPPPAPPPAASFTLHPPEPLSFSQLLRDTHTPVKDGSNAKKQDGGSTAWRTVDWTHTERSALVQRLSSYAPCCRDVGRARVLLLGPVGSGKSSFISSVDSVFEGRVTNRAMVGQGQSSFTQKLQSFPLCPSKRTCALELWDSMGFGDCSGPNLQQLLSVVKGHAPEGYEFRAEQALSSDTEGYIKRPGLREQMHCVAFVLDASKVLTSSYSKGTGVFLRQLRRHVSDLGVHQVVLLTHVDQICNKTQKDTSEVYTSSVIRQMVMCHVQGGRAGGHVPVLRGASEELLV
ncbi:interferon-induced protein 44-like isoform X2 [Periophthalmus magnuspinnatus]|uniref:interferon-induced protein 44-like isoform X2 n=1 Tax=Periophthalmus magnuspinnatus TaxID=409849 RepID=UPI00145C17D8|nr:interferon-induced protein 44-like isoform X2 [Periophthalmus magnuspinnatus]